MEAILRQVLIKHGKAVLEELPAPRLEPDTVLIQVRNSCISTGTELSGVKSSGQPLWKKALSQPEKVKKAMQMVASQGLSKTRAAVGLKMNSGFATGYSAAGIILEVGSGISDLFPGDRVACAGAQYAFHAEIIRVPRNLTVPIPEAVGFPDASTVTLGAIALQGVRRSQPTLGEAFIVIGLGPIGQITVQILKANGCTVLGMDLDPRRLELARTLGMDAGLRPEDGNPIEQVARLTGGIGADGVIITAASASHEILSTAFQMCRKKGRVVLVGDVGMNINREDIYQKELDFFISTSYGPGRYDSNYEEKGMDYPVSYVRWTENRNMGEYLRLLASGKVSIQPVVAATYPLEEATQAYESLQAETARPLMVLLSYPPPLPGVEYARKTLLSPSRGRSGPEAIRIAVAGAGNFAKGMHLPNLMALPDLFGIRAIMSRTGHNSLASAKQFGAVYATTDFRQVLQDPEVDAVLIATRHDLHAPMVLESLRAGKHVLVEKPLALDRAELAEIEAFYSATGGDKPILLTGFNRRFSPMMKEVREATKARINPMIINYRMNAGYVPLDNWVHANEGGGRNIGEACHIYDLFNFLTQSEVVDVQSQSIRPGTGYYTNRDNFIATVKYRDGSVASLVYTAMGSAAFPKERLEVMVEGKVLVVDDFKTMTVAGSKARSRESARQEKGQKEELEAFASAIKSGDWAIPLWQQLQAMEIAFRVEDGFTRK